MWLPAWLPRPTRSGALVVVFKSIGDSLPGSVATWTFSRLPHHASQDHPAYIPRELNPLIRRYSYRRPASFRAVRDLGRVPARCSRESGELGGRSCAWLPAWLPAHVTPGTMRRWSSSPTSDLRPARGPRPALLRPPPPNPTAAGPGDGRVRSRPSSRVHELGSFTEMVVLRSQTVLTGSGSHRSAYGGFGGGHPHFHLYVCLHPYAQHQLGRCIDHGR